MFLHVLLILIKHSTALTIGSYSLNCLIKAYLNILLVYLHFGTKIKKCVSNGRWYFLRLFGIGNGVRQGGILSPFLFRFYIRKLIAEVVKLRIGCNIGGIFLNLFAYADDMVLIAPSWFALQKLLVTIQDEATSINMSFNTKKNCMHGI